MNETIVLARIIVRQGQDLDKAHKYRHKLKGEIRRLNADITRLLGRPIVKPPPITSVEEDSIKVNYRLRKEMRSLEKELADANKRLQEQNNTIFYLRQENEKLTLALAKKHT